MKRLRTLTLDTCDECMITLLEEAKSLLSTNMLHKLRPIGNHHSHNLSNKLLFCLKNEVQK